MRIQIFSVAVSILAFGVPVHQSTADSVTTEVLGKFDPWLASAADGTVASECFPGSADRSTAPLDSPAEVTGNLVVPGNTLSFSASGQAAYLGQEGYFSGPNGITSQIVSHTSGAERGIASVTTPINSLVGVFLGPQNPDLSPAPADFDFSSAESRDYSSLAPALKQPFFIGDGHSTLVGLHVVVVPEGATRLFLGIMDGCNYSDNGGAYTVTIDVSPPTNNAPTIAITGNQVQVCWDATSNTTYRVEVMTNSIAGQWQVLSNNISGTGSVFCVMDPIPPTERARFYRVVPYIP